MRWPSLPNPAPPLVGDGFVLRPWRVADADALNQAWAEPSVGGRLGAPQADLETARSWIKGVEARIEQASALDYVVEVAGAVAGEIGLSSFDPTRHAALVGYWIHPERRGAGLGAAALGELTQWCFDTLGLQALVAECDDENRASWRTAESAGYRRIGTRGTTRVYARRSDAPTPNLR